jgi:hypothetical protein
MIGIAGNAAFAVGGSVRSIGAGELDVAEQDRDRANTETEQWLAAA